MPPLEDLANDEHLAAWRIWAEQEGVMQESIQTQARATGWETLAVGRQRGATGSKHAVTPVVGFGVGKNQHFEAACSVNAEALDPLSMEAKAAPDLRFAAEKTMQHARRARELRQEFRGLVRELREQDNTVE